MSPFEEVAAIIGGIVTFFSVGGLGYTVIVYWRKSEREAGKAEQYRVSSTEIIEDLRTRLRDAESRPYRCQTCPLWQRESSA